ncbi:MAG: LPS export ABC transporter periplasmic protein LptC [Candidatus Omnitrophica bacterium]|nr:LPS export ABC transporter periplasmic protein LptC [Candidatus Omnitrophota bacterium]
MFKRLIGISIIVLVLYVLYLFSKIYLQPPDPIGTQEVQQPPKEEVEVYKIYDFSFSKYNMSGTKELEIEGKSADMFAKIVRLDNVIAKAYAEDVPVTITADTGMFDKTTSLVQLRDNVVATTDDGARLTSQALDIRTDTNTVETDQLAEVFKDTLHLQGIGAICDQKIQRAQFKRNVKLTVERDGADDGDVKKGQVVVTCDGPLDIDYETGLANFSDNVIAVDENGILKSDKMDVYYDKDAGDVEKIYAYGNVIILQDESKTYCDNVLYLAREGKTILGGEPESFVIPKDD